MISLPIRSAYGGDRSQFGELYRPSGRAHPGTVVIIHGGFWRAQYDLGLGRPLALDLAARGHVVWNLEYRRVGNGGGWPATFEDVAAGIDHLTTLEVDLSSVVAIGHSAGGQLAVWAAGVAASTQLTPPPTPPRLALTGVIAQAGVLDLATAAEQDISDGAVVELLGGRPDQHPDRYARADPIGQVPLRVPVRCLHSPADADVPFAQSTAYVRAATAAGADVRLIQTEGDHMTLIDPASDAWQSAVDACRAWAPADPA